MPRSATGRRIDAGTGADPDADAGASPDDGPLRVGPDDLTDQRPGARRDPAGVTLLELVVVLAILSLLATPAVLRYGGGGGFGAGASAQRVAALFRADLSRMRDRALFGQVRLGLEPQADGWGWRDPPQDGDADPGWRDTGTASVFEGVVLDWQIDGRPFRPPLDPDPGAAPALVIRPDGTAPALVLRIAAPMAAAGAGPAAVVCRFDGWGELVCDR